MALGSREGLEEERRLFYVSVTRARRDLAIYVPLRYHHHRIRDDHSWAQPSRFLSDSVRAALEETPFIDPNALSVGAPAPLAIDASSVVAGQISELW
jgi:DNA helicase-2/ATP-dependent DNA helicase PcrA